MKNKISWLRDEPVELKDITITDFKPFKHEISQGIIFEVNNEKCEAKYPKAKLTIYNYTFYFYKKFNWFNRLMFRLLLGLKVENIKENK